MMSEVGKEIERTFPVKMDHRGRITIPSNIRFAHGLELEEGDEIWLEMTLHEAGIRKGDDDGGDQ